MTLLVVSSISQALFHMGSKDAGSCTAALFLKAFVDEIEPKEGEAQPAVRWAHLDIAGAMEVRGDSRLKTKSVDVV